MGNDNSASTVDEKGITDILCGEHDYDTQFFYPLNEKQSKCVTAMFVNFFSKPPVRASLKKESRHVLNLCTVGHGIAAFHFETNGRPFLLYMGRDCDRFEANITVLRESVRRGKARLYCDESGGYNAIDQPALLITLYSNSSSEPSPFQWVERVTFATK